jgi:hypothetical protein
LGFSTLAPGNFWDFHFTARWTEKGRLPTFLSRWETINLLKILTHYKKKTQLFIKKKITFAKYLKTIT